MENRDSGAKITLDISIEGGAWPQEAHMRALAERVMSRVFALPHLRGSASELSLVFTDDAAIRALNRTWRNQDRPTNVLSFPAFSVKAGEKPQFMLGDVILAYETVMREAEAEQKTADSHISHLILHGLLHLLGYDHQTEAQAAQMETLEKEILAQLGIDDPYGGDL